MIAIIKDIRFDKKESKKWSIIYYFLYTSHKGEIIPYDFINYSVMIINLYNVQEIGLQKTGSARFW